MNQPTTWTAATVAEALDLLRAVQDRLDSGMRAAYPGRETYKRAEQGRNIPVSLSITFDTSELDRTADERSVFDNQVSDL